MEKLLTGVVRAGMGVAGVSFARGPRRGVPNMGCADDAG